MPAYQQIFLPILIVVRTLIALQLVRASRDKGLLNLRWLALHFAFACLGDIALRFLASRWMFALGQALGEMSLIMFIHQTFYKDRKSPYRIFLGIAAIYAVAGMAIGLNKPMPPSPTPVNPFDWGWLIVVSYQVYKQTRADQHVEDWIKWRYRLVIAYAAILLISPINTTLNFLSPGLLPSSAWTQVVAGAIQYLVWVMPGAFKGFLNRNYRPVVPSAGFSLEMSEEEILRQFQTSKS